MDVHVAQINVGTMLAATDDPLVAEFMDGLLRVNAIADAAPGFVWRLQTEAGDATSIQIFDDPLTLVNMSVWTSVDALKAYVYRSEHVEFFRRRAEWFRPEAKRVALWHVAAGEIPSLDEAIRRVAFLERNGPTPYAFGFATPPLPLVFERTTPDEPGTVALIERLDAELSVVTAGACDDHLSLAATEVTEGRGHMIRARFGERLVGCGAVRIVESDVGELKRMYVDPAWRGLKLGAAILDQLELHAGRLGLTRLKLQTSTRQPAAVRLYTGFGFERCAPWGEYLQSAATSLCFAKPLDRAVSAIPDAR